eukprot:gnl/Dysnectes_brevis/5515_a7967_314.p1 GENE.gnl/Dysnectes_brevis/5515_a7967_314~~gnl/Dysnectes_brevis/5515_a7967_314.p1  ORF type:complete len:241 (+),score=57.15 gnl/Dysnectes_brevis/5515_a7967_314:21-743(+)
MDEDNFCIRQLSQLDWDSVVSLHNESFPLQYPDSFFQLSCRMRLPRQQPVITLGIYTTNPQPELLGCAVAKLVSDIDAPFPLQNLPPANTPTVLMYLMTIAVRPDHRARGLGLRLLSATEHAAAHQGAVGSWLHVMDVNRTALRFYTVSAHYQPVGTICDYYTLKDRVHGGIMMGKRFGPMSDGLEHLPLPALPLRLTPSLGQRVLRVLGLLRRDLCRPPSGHIVEEVTPLLQVEVEPEE